jgi:hypothetical protein
VSSKKRENKNEKRKKFSLVGRTLQNIWLAADVFDLAFDGNAGVLVRGEYSLQTSPRSEPKAVKVPEFIPELTKLLGQTVENESVTVDGAIAIRFSSGALLTCYLRIPGAGIYIV